MRKPKAFFNVLAVELAVFALIVIFIMVETMAASLAVIALLVLGLLVLLRSSRKTGGLARSFALSSRQTLISTVLLGIALPLFFLKNTYVLYILTFSLIYAIAALGLNFQIGSAGMVNFAQGSFLGIGAYTTALLSQRLGIPFWIGLPAALVTTGAFGLLLGYPSLKTKSFYLSLVSIAFCYIAFLLIHNMKWTGGPDGIAGIMKPTIFGFSLARGLHVGVLALPGGLLYYYLTFLFFLLAAAAAWRFHHSWLGLAWNAIREDEIASQCYGINITRSKLLAFALGSMFAGLGGVLDAHLVGFVSPENMIFSVGLLLVCMVILGGLDNIPGVIVGSVFLVLIPEKFRAFQDFRLLFYGLILIGMLLFRPQGLFPVRPRRYAVGGGSGRESRSGEGTEP